MMLNVAILGAGIGAQHLDGYLALPDRYRVAAICDLDAEKAGALAAKAPGCAAVSDADAVIADPAIDIIDICLPPHLHGPIAMKAFAAGKHVICEKPIAGSVAEADRMLEAAQASGRLFAPIFQYRYGRGLYQLAALQERGLAGKPLVATLETHWNRTADYYAVPWRGKWASERGGAVLGHFGERIVSPTDDEARKEADRCMSCGMCFECDNCVIFCPQDAVFKVSKDKQQPKKMAIPPTSGTSLSCHLRLSGRSTKPIRAANGCSNQIQNNDANKATKLLFANSICPFLINNSERKGHHSN